MNESISATQLKEAALKIKANPDATRELAAAVRAGDQVSAARILRSNGAPPPAHTTIEFEPGPISIKPDDTCFEVTVTHQEKNGTVTDTYRIRMYAC